MDSRRTAEFLADARHEIASLEAELADLRQIEAILARRLADAGPSEAPVTPAARADHAETARDGRADAPRSLRDMTRAQAITAIMSERPWPHTVTQLREELLARDHGTHLDPVIFGNSINTTLRRGLDKGLFRRDGRGWVLVDDPQAA